MTQPAPNLDGLRIAREKRTRAKSVVVPVAAALLALLLIATAIWWYSRARPIEVRTVAAREQTSAASERTVLNASGYVTARREATVSSKVTGKVNEILIEEGMTVIEGQVLARLDDSNVRANFDLARAQAEVAKAALGETRVRLNEARQELQRQTELKTRAVSAQADFDHAEAAVLALHARLEQQQAEASAAERTVAVWARQVEDTIIRAPFGGTVTSKNAQPGEMISPMSTGGFTRTGICTIVDMQSLEIEIDVNESYINRVQPGQRVEATLDAYSDWKIPCRVIAIIPTADRNKSTVRVRVGFETLDPRILPEMSVKVSFQGGRPPDAEPRRGVLVPKTAIAREEGRATVMVVARGRAERRAVSVGATEADAILVTAGLQSGERVVAEPPKGLSDGSAVREIAP